MQRFFLLALLVLLALAGPAIPVSAHPIDSINTDQYSRLEVGLDVVRLRYVIEMGDIPAYAERRAVDANNDAQLSADEQERYAARRIPELIAGLRLTAGGEALALRLVSKELSFPTIEVADLEGGLITMRLALDLEAALPAPAAAIDLAYSNENFADQPGWREIVALPLQGVTLSGSTALERNRSDELRSYPADALAQPLDMRSASVSARPLAGAPPAVPATTPAEPVPQQERPRDDLVALLASPLLAPGGVAFALLLAFVLGAGHALAPGHGKTIVAAYLVGRRGRGRDALFLGLVTTLTHTGGVFVLGAITLQLSTAFLPSQLFPWLELISGGLVLALGLVLLRGRLAALRHRHDHDHDHDHDHGHDHGHGHALPGAEGEPVSWRGLLALGVSGGLLPCPSALVVLLGAVALHRVAFGLLLILAFSAGLAAVLTGIGLLLVYARRLFERLPSDGRVLRGVLVASAGFVALAGLSITVSALAQVAG